MKIHLNPPILYHGFNLLKMKMIFSYGLQLQTEIKQEK